MAQVTGHEVDAKGDHYLTFDDGRQVVVPYDPELVGKSWGDILAASGESGNADAKPKGKTRSG